MNKASTIYRSRPKDQKGAAAIEAALMFVIFFTLFYAIVSYSLPLLMVQAFNHAAASGARAGVAIEPSDPDCGDGAQINNAAYQSCVESRVRDVVGDTLSWLPASAGNVVLGSNNDNVAVDINEVSGALLLNVTVSFPGYRDNPLIPTLTLPGIGDVPRLPENLTGTASVTL